MSTRFTWFNWFALIIGLLFLYLPILILIIYSFNDSKLVTVWGGFSTRWYQSLWMNKSMLDAALNTFKIAIISSTFAVFLGTISAFALNKFGKFRGRLLFSSMIYAPMVMPEVIIGLSLLLTFVALSMDRGFLTVTIAHITFTMCYVAVVVQSRLSGFDRHIEEAAMDLGANTFRTFIYVTFPMILPGIISGWLLSFTLSLDDLVISSFTSGPGSTTLPMKIYSQVRLGVTPEINAVCTILIGVIATGVISLTILHRIMQKRHEQDEQATRFTH